jgi:hypothetical protein
MGCLWLIVVGGNEEGLRSLVFPWRLVKTVEMGWKLSTNKKI